MRKRDRVFFVILAVVVATLAVGPQKISGQGTSPDLNNDGKVDIFDLVIASQNYGKPYTIFDLVTISKNLSTPSVNQSIIAPTSTSSHFLVRVIDRSNRFDLNSELLSKFLESEGWNRGPFNIVLFEGTGWPPNKSIDGLDGYPYLRTIWIDTREVEIPRPGALVNGLSGEKFIAAVICHELAHAFTRSHSEWVADSFGRQLLDKFPQEIVVPEGSYPSDPTLPEGVSQEPPPPW